MNTRKMIMVLLLAGLILPLTGCEQDGADMADADMAPSTDEAMAAIDGVRTQFMQAIGQGDAAAAAATYAPDAKIYRDDGSMGSGTQAIQETYQGLLDAGFTASEVTPTETVVMGHTAWEIGTYTYTGQSAEGEAMTLSGEYIALLEHEDGMWKLVRTVGFTRGMPEEASMDDAM